MSDSFFFYDLETSGRSAAKDRIMQFAGIRLDKDLRQVADPVDIKVRLSEDSLPEPEAVLVSGQSPLANVASGISEADFTKLFNEQITEPSTVFVGFNNLRFDDEFIRYTLYRNFYDAYSWHYKDNRSRWDMLDLVRMMRALRPAGINWPTDETGKPTNKLELLTKANNLEHTNAHDALSDAQATASLARLIKKTQPKLFSFLLNLRSKSDLLKFVKANPSFVYTSSHYSSEVLHTTVVAVISVDESAGTVEVFDLRENAKQFLDLSVEELTKLWQYNPDARRPRLPVKTMKLNRCPAVAPISVLDSATVTSLNLDLGAIESNLTLVKEHQAEFVAKLKAALRQLDKDRELRRLSEPRIPTVDERLYEKFIPDHDRNLFPKARQAASLDQPMPDFTDKRLQSLFPLYKARNWPLKLNAQELEAWREFVNTKLFSGPDSSYTNFMKQLDELTAVYKSDKTKLSLLNDLRSYGLNIAAGYEKL